MQITNITQIENIKDYHIGLLIIILIVYTIIFFCSIEIKNQDDKETPLIIFIVGIIVVSLSFFIAISEFKEATEYSIEYNNGTLTKTMTTQEIIDYVLQQDTFYDKDKETSNIIIKIPRNNFNLNFTNYNCDSINDIFYKHVEEMHERREEKHRKKDKNEKYLHETHTINIKGSP